MASAEIDLGDFTCSICREIFENPVSLNCSHCYCKECLIGLKRSSSSASEDSDELENPEERILKQPEATPAARSSIIYTPRILEPDQSFTCAICREVSNGYSESRDLAIDLETLPYQCPHCSTELLLGELRQHQETCATTTKKVDVEEIRKALAGQQVKSVLSEMQLRAREEAREGQNRSTFPCPFCSNANFTVKELLRHIEREHADADQHQVCPVCAAMPWGDRTLVSRHVYGHLKERHLFNYETYVNYDQDEETMIALAIEKSLGID